MIRLCESFTLQSHQTLAVISQVQLNLPQNVTEEQRAQVIEPKPEELLAK